MGKKQQFIRRLNKGFGLSIPLDSIIYTSRGYWTQSVLHWSFYFDNYPIGSQYSISALLKYSLWQLCYDSHGSYEVYPALQTTKETDRIVVENKQGADKPVFHIIPNDDIFKRSIHETKE